MLVRKFQSKRDKPGGQFEWVDGILVTALKKGHWLLLKNANLCRYWNVDHSLKLYLHQNVFDAFSFLKYVVDIVVCLHDTAVWNCWFWIGGMFSKKAVVLEKTHRKHFSEDMQLYLKVLYFQTFSFMAEISNLKTIDSF